MKEVTLKPGGFLSGQKFTLDDKFLSYKNAYGKTAKIPRAAIATAVIEPYKMGQSILKIIGSGTELVKITMPNLWCEQAQEWIVDNLNS